MIKKKRMKDINLYKIYVFIFAKERELKSDRISWIFFFLRKVLGMGKKKKQLRMLHKVRKYLEVKGSVKNDIGVMAVSPL